MTPHLSDEHEDCLNWARWTRDCDPKLWYPRKWSLPDSPTDSRIAREEEQQHKLEKHEVHSYDENRALATDGLLRLWLRSYREGGDWVAKAHFRVLRAAYVLRMNVGELSVLEALRALKDLKESRAQRQRVAA